MAEMLSNVIGAPFSEYVLTQLSLRATHNSSLTRTNDEVMFIANKTAWVRLTSSVQINKNQEVLNVGAGTLPGFKPVSIPNPLLNQYYKSLLGTPAIGYNDSDSLRKNWILEAGTSISTGDGIDLRSGIGPEGAYGLGGTEELGYRPMPGLTSVEIDTVGTLGSLRQANIQFKVWNINQLNVMEALYFRLGYSMILEWGHTQYYQNKGVGKQGTFVTNTYGLDLFSSKMRKEEVQQKISKLTYDSSGNYQGMLGIVSNFNWSMNQEGGYDCTVKLIGLGAVIDSLRINSSYKMPDSLQEIYDAQQAMQKREQQEAEELKKKLDRQKIGLTSVPVTFPKNIDEVYTVLFATDLGEEAKKTSAQEFFRTISYYSDYQSDPTLSNYIPDYYYKAVKGGKDAVPKQREEIDKVAGLFITTKDAKLNFKATIPANVTVNYPQPIKLDTSYFNKRYQEYTTAYPSPNQNNFILTTKTLGFNNVLLETLFPSSQVRDSILENVIIIEPESKSIIDVSTAYLATLENKYRDRAYIREVVTVVLPYIGRIPGVIEGTTIDKTFFVAIKFIPSTASVIAADLFSFFNNWLNNKSGIANVIDIQTDIVNQNKDTYYKNLYITANIPTTTPKDPTIQIITNDTSYIAATLSRPEEQTITPPVPEIANEGDTAGDINSTTSGQVDPGERFNSALHIMLNVVKSQLKTEASKRTGVTSASLLPTTKLLYNDGILNGVLADKAGRIESVTPLNDVRQFDLLQYALKGFNSNLMSDPTVYNEVESVKFDKLCTGYLIPYVQKDAKGLPNYPTYIKFGYLLAFLNNMCLIYDSTQDTDKHPYVYLDFNPETNLCLSNPQHLSVDPYTCMIPFQGTDDDYIKIFPEGISRESLSKEFNNAPLTDTLNTVSKSMESFKGNTLYQGKTMEILLNIDFLLETLKQYTSNDREHAINLKGFLDAIVTGVNKATGNINLFRVAYRDDSNTIIIKDDQFVPSLQGESTSMESVNGNQVIYNDTLGPIVPRYGQLPVFGVKSLVREMQFQTDLSTAISNQIAISAQASTGSVNSTDHSPFSYLNVNYSDAYKPFVRNVAAAKITTKPDEDKLAINDLKQAGQFNQHLRSIYSINTDKTLSTGKIDMATNYYINSMSNLKATDGITSAAPFIPANLSLTLDGIGGVIMGQAFTIDQDRLPLSLRSVDDPTHTKVGFIVVGLTHTVQNNQWLTKIRGQMIKLRDTTNYATRLTPITSSQKTKANTDNSRITIANTPWSAAFISYVMQQAGVTSFPLNSNHLAYAQKLRATYPPNSTDKNGFKVLDTTTTKIEVGDLIVKGRSGNNVSFNTKEWSGNGHGDIIVGINSNTALLVGGNEGDTVQQTSVGLVDGKLGKSDFFVILRPPKDSVNKIVSITKAEYKNWSTGKWKEDTAAARQSLTAYYKTVGINV